MAFYLYKASYSKEGVKALVAEPQDREVADRTVIEALGGKRHSFFFALGDSDIIAIVEAPDDTTIAAGSMIVGTSDGISNVSTTKLLDHVGSHGCHAQGGTPPSGPTKARAAEARS